MSTVESIRELVEIIEDDDNDFGTAEAAWTTWQGRAEALAELVVTLLDESRVEADADPNALTWAGIPHDSTAFQIEQGSGGTADWRESPEGIPASARLTNTFTRVYTADDWALGALHTGEAAEVWAVTTGGEFRLYIVSR